MNYRHAYHAGNFADVLKHAALVAILLHLRKKETPFAVIDTHTGRGLYDIGGAEAKKTGEAEGGILRLMREPALPGALAPYCDLVRGFGPGVYPGSPLVAARLLREKDRLVAIEKHPDEFAVLAAQVAGDRRVRAVNGDGYAEILRLMPPRERRGVILIDPPYESDDEFPKAVHALIEAHRRFANGIFLLWYPAKARPAVAAASGELLNAGISALKVELDVGGSEGPPEGGRGPPLTATGLIVVNPPFGFADEMKAIVPFLAKSLGKGIGARGTVDTITCR
jgi:23S rRNA (adenine2030-N6)-methyltransferase